ncbi:MAG: FkbM family methyltransferase [Limisphaerales bacterium]
MTGLPNRILSRLPPRQRVRFKRLIRRVYERDPHSIQAALKRLQASGSEFGSILDVGAAVGAWTEWALVYFPNSRYLLFEPVVENEARLAALKRDFPNMDYSLAAAGDVLGEARMQITENLTGSTITADQDPDARSIRLTTLDDEVRAKGLQPPFLVKLDTHGYEVPILQGARETLRNTEVLIVEVYNFNFSPTVRRFAEMVQLIESQGFRVFDAIEPIRRPGDEAFWQMDLLFRRETAPGFRRSTYR